MLDKQGRVAIGQELLSKNKSIVLNQKVNIFFDPKQKRILISSMDINIPPSGMYFLRSTTMELKGRIYIPRDIRDAFPKATFLPAEKDGKIYILIIEPEKKPE